jgi:diguanylate cyclase (GGDEF)-like protein/PAS domain S-box-containing protein
LPTDERHTKIGEDPRACATEGLQTMNESTPMSPEARVALARALAGTMGVAESALSGALLEGLERTGAGVIVKDVADDRYLYASASLESKLGTGNQALIGRTDAQLFSAENCAALRGAEHAAITRRGAQAIDFRQERDGQRHEYEVTIFPLVPSEGSEARHWLSVWVDVSEARRQQAQLAVALKQLEQHQQASEVLRMEAQDQSLRDRVTGLYQREHFDDQLRREVDLSSREHREFALVSIALDAPSEALRAAAPAGRTRVVEALGRLLRSNTRAMDASCRLDDDNFAVLLSGVGLATAHSRMEGLRRQCATQIVVLEGRDLGFSVSMGVASFPHTAHTQEELKRAAEVALRDAQRRGGNHVTLAAIRFEPS